MNSLLSEFHKEIHVYRTHIEISPYKQNENFEIQKLFSKYNYIYRRYEKIAYMVKDGTLYIPRIADLNILESIFHAVPVVETAWDLVEVITRRKYKMLKPPRDRIQNEAIDFLTSNGKFHYTIKNAQYGLNLDTGDGKTYCTVNAIIQSGMKAIIILPKTSIKNQWIKTFDEMTNVPLDRIMNIESSDDMVKIMKSKHDNHDFYTINHQLVTSFGKKHGWDSLSEFFNRIAVGIKVYDECHKFFGDTMMIDFFTNTKKSYYLTATFARSDYKENLIYQLAYSNMNRFGEETRNYEEKRKHIIAVPILYSSGASDLDKHGMYNKSGSFSGYNFIDYAIGNGTIFRILTAILDKITDMEGRVLITVPKIESTEVFANRIREYFIERDVDKTVVTVHSKHSTEDNLTARKEADYIVSTIKSIGEGDDLKGLRAIINFEPIGSWNIAHQLRGRLREYDKEKMTFLFYPIDTSIPKLMRMYKRILPDMQASCKEIVETTMYDV